VAMAIQPTPLLTESRLFSRCPEQILTTLTTRNCTQNLHNNGVKPATYETNSNLKNFFNVLSVNVDLHPGGLPFVSTIEAKNYPVWATQWHPERNQFEWGIRETLDHSWEAIQAMQYVATFFVNETRKNFNTFQDRKVEAKALINNYCGIDTDNDPGFCCPDLVTYFIPLRT